MPLKYKEPLTWKHKKTYPRPFFGHWERDLFIKVIEGIPYGAECKLTVQWNPPKSVDEETEKVLQKVKKTMKKRKPA